MRDFISLLLAVIFFNSVSRCSRLDTSSPAGCASMSCARQAVLLNWPPVCSLLLCKLSFCGLLLAHLHGPPAATIFFRSSSVDSRPALRHTVAALPHYVQLAFETISVGAFGSASS